MPHACQSDRGGAFRDPRYVADLTRAQTFQIQHRKFALHGFETPDGVEQHSSPIVLGSRRRIQVEWDLLAALPLTPRPIGECDIVRDAVKPRPLTRAAAKMRQRRPQRNRYFLKKVLLIARVPPMPRTQPAESRSVCIQQSFEPVFSRRLSIHVQFRLC